MRKNKKYLQKIQKINLILFLIFAIFCIPIFVFEYGFFNNNFLKLNKFLQNQLIQNWIKKNNLAYNLYIGENYKKAEKSYEKIIKEIPCTQLRCRLLNIKLKAYENLIEIYKKQNKLKKASQIYEKLNTFAPKNIDYYYQWGLLEIERKKYNKALKIFKKLFKYNSEYIPAIEKKIEILFLQKKYQELINYWEEFKNLPHFFISEDLEDVFSKKVLDLINLAYEKQKTKK